MSTDGGPMSPDIGRSPETLAECLGGFPGCPETLAEYLGRIGDVSGDRGNVGGGGAPVRLGLKTHPLIHN